MHNQAVCFFKCNACFQQYYQLYTAGLLTKPVFSDSVVLSLVFATVLGSLWKIVQQTANIPCKTLKSETVQQSVWLCIMQQTVCITNVL